MQLCAGMLGKQWLTFPPARQFHTNAFVYESCQVQSILFPSHSSSWLAAWKDRLLRS